MNRELSRLLAVWTVTVKTSKKAWISERAFKNGIRPRHRVQPPGRSTVDRSAAAESTLDVARFVAQDLPKLVHWTELRSVNPDT